MCSELAIMFRIRGFMEEEMWVWKEEQQKQKKNAKNKEKRSKTCAKVSLDLYVVLEEGT